MLCCQTLLQIAQAYIDPKPFKNQFTQTHGQKNNAANVIERKTKDKNDQLLVE